MHAARVAPEKTVFRPVLPMCFPAGLNGQQMAAKLTYKEQLLHPNWQRKRLEMLEGANFSCDNCGDTEKTLHVHHRRYIKGRQVWEYEASELAVLCADCHQQHHSEREMLERLITRADIGGGLTALLGLIAGYVDGELGADSDLIDACTKDAGHYYDLGIMASITSGADWPVMAQAARIMLRKMFTPPQAAAVARWNGEE